MLRRILLIVAIVLAAAAAGVNFVVVKDKVDQLTTSRNNERDAKVAAQTEAANTKDKLDKTTQDLKKSQADLAGAQKERDDAVAKAAAQSKRADSLTEELAKTKKERDDAQDLLARYKATGFTPEQILVLGKQLKDAQDALEVANTEKQLIARKLRNTQIELAKILTPDIHIPLDPKLKGQVVMVDPKWEFVVLNVGDNQGVLKDGELLVNRDGKLVAKVRVATVQKDQSIANVVPGWKLGDVYEGDQVIPAYPGALDTALGF